MKIKKKLSRAGCTVEFTHRETAVFRELADLGAYGKNSQDVIRYLVKRQVDDLIRTGVIKP